MYNPNDYQRNRYPEVSPEQRAVARSLRWFDLIFLTLFPVWLGWTIGMSNLPAPAALYGIELDKLNCEQFIPVLNRTIHLEGIWLCGVAGAFLGLLAGGTICSIIQKILKLKKLLPKPITRARDEIIPEDWSLELQDTADWEVEPYGIQFLDANTPVVGDRLVKPKPPLPEFLAGIRKAFVRLYHFTIQDFSLP